MEGTEEGQGMGDMRWGVARDVLVPVLDLFVLVVCTGVCMEESGRRVSMRCGCACQ